jgi:hypothetical protein
MILASGAAHAVVSAILKSGRDKLSSRALIDGFSALLVLPVVFFVPIPVAAFPWMAGSWIDHLFYLICLVKAFEAADMTVAYPIARGSAPVSPCWCFMRPPAGLSRRASPWCRLV